MNFILQNEVQCYEPNIEAHELVDAEYLYADCTSRYKNMKRQRTIKDPPAHVIARSTWNTPRKRAKLQEVIREVITERLQRERANQRS